MDLDPNPFGAGQPCFGCAQDHPVGFRLRFTREGDEVSTRFVPTDTYQGPPGIMHGGLVMTLADEIGAWTLIGLIEKFGFTAQISGRLKKPVRIGREIVGTGRITKPGTRVVTVGVRLEQERELVFEAELGFVLVDATGAEKLLDGPLPEAWKRFCR